MITSQDSLLSFKVAGRASYFVSGQESYLHQSPTGMAVIKDIGLAPQPAQLHWPRLWLRLGDDEWPLSVAALLSKSPGGFSFRLGTKSEKTPFCPYFPGAYSSTRWGVLLTAFKVVWNELNLTRLDNSYQSFSAFYVPTIPTIQLNFLPALSYLISHNLHCLPR